MTSAGVAAIYGGSAPHHRTLTTPKYRRHLHQLIYLPHLATTDLAPYRCLLIPERLHRGLLEAAATPILHLLAAGGTIVTFTGGEPLPEFLPGVVWEHRPTNYWWWREPFADLGLISPSPHHPLLRHIRLTDATWHYHGILHPPAGTDTVVALPTGEALLYVDQVSTPGTLVVATLDPISHYGSYFMPATERFLDGFLPWLANEAASRTGLMPESTRLQPEPPAHVWGQPWFFPRAPDETDLLACGSPASAPLHDNADAQNDEIDSPGQ